jgi:mannose-6-phosphate isomerase
MRAPQDRVAEAIRAISETDVKDPVVDLIRELDREYPGGDVGVLSVFFLNIVDLLPGQCLFMGPNVPHAYLIGDIVECMTCSDNVIRGGLTPKFKDVETLVESLNYESSGSPELFKPTFDSTPGVTTWKPVNVPFSVSRFVIDSPKKTFTWRSPTKGASIVLIMQGSGRVGDIEVHEGMALLIEPDKDIEIFAASSMEFFMAFNPL